MKKIDFKNIKFEKVNTEEKYGLKESNAIMLFVVFILAIIEIAVALKNIIAPVNADIKVKAIFSLITLLCAVIYGAFGYKKPHGNLLRYLMLLYAITTACKVSFTSTNNQAAEICNLIAIILVAYMAGRLNKYTINTYLIIVVLTLLLVKAFVGISTGNITFGKVIGQFSAFTQFSIIAAAYLSRYHLHKEAGLEDKK